MFVRALFPLSKPMKHRIPWMRRLPLWHLGWNRGMRRSPHRSGIVLGHGLQPHGDTLTTRELKQDRSNTSEDTVIWMSKCHGRYRIVAFTPEG